MSRALGLILIFMLGFMVSFGTVVGFRVWQAQPGQQRPFPPTATEFKLQPPAQSLTAHLTSATGQPLKEPRDTKDLVPLNRFETLVEGEVIVTDATSSASLAFGELAAVEALASTTIALSDTQPAHFVLAQRSGTAQYFMSQPTGKLSVRVLSTLFEFKSNNYGSVEISINPNQKTVTFKPVEGEGTLAFVNKDNQTVVQAVAAGQMAEFNTSTKTSTLR